MTNTEISRYGTRRWYNEKQQHHRIDGPAVIYNNGYTRWFLNDKIYCDNKSFQKAANLGDEDMIAMVLKYGDVGHCDRVGIAEF